MQVIVITGDNKLTAEAICRKVGVFDAHEDLAGKSITGVEFMKLPLDKRRAMLDGNGGACFSRAEPKHKQVLCTQTSKQQKSACIVHQPCPPCLICPDLLTKMMFVPCLLVKAALLLGVSGFVRPYLPI